MKILIVSDSHGHNDKLRQVYLKHQNMDYYLHAGDSQSLPLMISPFVSVKGNCDYNNDFLNHLIIETPYGKLLIKHINDLSLDNLKDNNIKIFVFGHTHRRLFSLIENIYFVNPGSISLPRDSHGISYAILDINKDSVNVTFFNL